MIDIVEHNVRCRRSQKRNVFAMRTRNCNNYDQCCTIATKQRWKNRALRHAVAPRANSRAHRKNWLRIAAPKFYQPVRAPVEHSR